MRTPIMSVTGEGHLECWCEDSHACRGASDGNTNVVSDRLNCNQRLHRCVIEVAPVFEHAKRIAASGVSAKTLTILNTKLRMVAPIED
jgi:hypothetical protein